MSLLNTFFISLLLQTERKLNVNRSSKKTSDQNLYYLSLKGFLRNLKNSKLFLDISKTSGG